MNVGIGLPATIPNTPPELIVEWAKRADIAGFSSLGIIDRLVYPNFEPMMTLAAVSSVTRQVRLMTTVLVAPLRNAAILAKEAATLDKLSGGRLTLGFGIGGREDDSKAAGITHRRRARRFEQQLNLMRKAWSQQPIGEHVGTIGPPPVQPGGPEVLIGGYTPTAASRAGRLGDGFIGGGGINAETALNLYKVAKGSWEAAGRKKKLRFVCSAYFALGENSAQKGAAYIRDYYGFMGPRVDGLVNSILSTPNSLNDAIRAYKDVGVHEVILWPTIAELEQVELASQFLKK
jgi:alkanesulfonate monooxygenase SsuD/methylene tetrahydromethanopterin reductase-like flavin-dependent oxidoreductase (luciferase family)